MGKKTFTFQYGDGEVSCELNEEQILGVLEGKSYPKLTDIASALNEALDAPIDSEPLSRIAKPTDRVALIVSDMSRFWMRQDLVVPHLVAYLHERCGIPYAQMTIVIANGTHASGSEKDLRTLVTDAVYEQVRTVNHECQADDLVEIGVTSRGNHIQINRHVAEADLVVALGAAAHHMMAGFGGGRKSILPGVSSLQTVRYNHAFSLHAMELRTNPDIGNAKLAGNPLNEDMCEAAALVKNLFMVNLVMNSDQKLYRIIAGHWLHSWEEACRVVDSIYRTPVKEAADVIITSCGGYPKDMSLYQGTKAIDNVESGLKPGGTLILLIEARDGGGPDEYFGWCKNLLDGTIEHRLRTEFTIPGYIFFLNCEQAARYRVMMLSKVPQEIVAPMGLESYSDLDTLLKAADLDGKTIYVIPNGGTVIPEVTGEA